MRTIDTSIIYDNLKQMIKQAGTNIECAAKQLISCAAERETQPAAAFALNVLCKNSQYASQHSLPVCQDTGMAVVFADIGQQVFLQGEFLGDVVNHAVRDAYRENGFRMSVTHPLTRVNTGDNTPAVLHTTVVKGDKIKLYFMAKGFGSENMSALYMLSPAGGIDAVMDSVVRCVESAGSNPCPPVVVGVGIGGTSDKAQELAKRALLRPTGQGADDADLRRMEQTLLTRINALNIGAQGFGGGATALAVHIEQFATHIAGLPVAVNIQCHCVRMQAREI